jgi:coenzyme Q-binding protein COQ10
MPKQEESKTVSYTKEQMFDLVADIDRYDEFLPWCNNSKIINSSTEGDKKIIIADLEIGYDQFVYTYRSEVKLHKDKTEINVRNLDGPFKYLENNWKFNTLSEHECEIQFNIDFELNISLLDMLMKKFFDLAFQKMVDAFISRANEIY